MDFIREQTWRNGNAGILKILIEQNILRKKNPELKEALEELDDFLFC